MLEILRKYGPKKTPVVYLHEYTQKQPLNTYLPNNVESIYLQIFDERSFTEDECIAWSRIVLPTPIFSGETVDEWYPLSGRQGEAQEGLVNLTMSFQELDSTAIQQQQEMMDSVDPELAAAIEASKRKFLYIF